MRHIASLLVALMFLAPMAAHRTPAPVHHATLGYHLDGVTMYPHYSEGQYIYLGTSWHHPAFTTYIDWLVATAVYAKVNTIRVTDYLENDSDAYDSRVYANIDYLFQATNAHGIKILFDLSGYRNWLSKNSYSPYNAANWQYWIPFVVNRYKSEPNLALWSIAGELPNSHQSGYIPPDQQVAFFSGVSSQIKSLDPDHPISTGSFADLNWNSGIDWQDIAALPTIDIVAMHVYSTGDLTITLPMIAQWSQTNGKPWLLEEFGDKQSDTSRASYMQSIYADAAQPWNVPPPQAGVWLPPAWTACTATTCAPSVGEIVWNLGPEINANGYDVGPQTPAEFTVLQQHGS